MIPTWTKGPCGWNILLEWQVSGTSPVAPWNCLGKTPGQSFQTLRWQQNPSHPPRLRLAEHDRCVRMIIATPLGQAKPTYHYIPLVSVVSSGLWFIKLCSKTLISKFRATATLHQWWWCCCWFGRCRPCVLVVSILLVVSWFLLLLFLSLAALVTVWSVFSFFWFSCCYEYSCF